MSHHLQLGIDGLKQRLADETESIVKRLSAVIGAVQSGDAAALGDLVQADAAIVRMETDIEQECLDLLLLQNPLAADFRLLVTCIKVNAELESISDLIVSIARRAESLTRPVAVQNPFDLKEMSNAVVEMLKASVGSVIRGDDFLSPLILTEKKFRTCQQHAIQTIESPTPGRPSDIPRFLQLLSVVHCLERMADAALRIADEVLYLVQGQIVRHRADSPRDSSIAPYVGTTIHSHERHDRGGGSNPGSSL